MAGQSESSEWQGASVAPRYTTATPTRPPAALPTSIRRSEGRATTIVSTRSASLHGTESSSSESWLRRLNVRLSAEERSNRHVVVGR